MTWQRRHSVLAILFSAYLLCYMDRMVIATVIPFIAEDFQLSPLAMGGVLSAFFIGYALMQIPGGLLADAFGPRRVMTAAIVGWSIFTALTGAAGTLPMLLAIRVLFGLSEGPYPPTASKTIALWFPQHEVGRANGIQIAAVNIGAAVAPLFVAPLILAWGWRGVFYSLLVPGVVLAVLVWLIVKDPPVRWEQESRDAPAGDGRIGLKDALRRPAVLWCAMTLFFANTAGWGLMNWLPTYLLRARGFDIAHTGIYASLPFLAGAVGCWLSGYISDCYFSQRRQIPIVFGLILSGALTYLAAIAPTGEWAVLALVLVFLCLWIALGGLFTLPLLIVPPAAVGGVFGIVNAVAQLAAFLSPLLIGYVLNATGGNFTTAFYCLVALFGLATLTAVKMKPLGKGYRV